MKKSLGIEEDQICVDEKTLWGSFDRSKSIKLIYIVNAWSTSASISLVKCLQRRNEITAIPELLDLPDLRSCLVSIDAMGCQKAIAQKVIEKKGNYLWR